MKRAAIIFLLLFVALLDDGATPGPFPADRLTVLIVEETDPRTPAVAAAINAADWQEYVESRGGQFRALDDDLDAESLKEPWKSAMKRASGKPVPWVVVAGGQAGYEGKLPTNDGALLNLLKGL